jgi:phosphohistidine phosphatase SixA
MPHGTRPGAPTGAGYCLAVPVFLVRHAHAGSRSGWQGDDAARPLSPKGHAQAAAIAAFLAGAPITYLGSSPAVRCVETLAPLVPDLEIDVHVLPELAEGSDVDGAVELVLSLAKSNAALCAHGDLIPLVIEALVDRGMSVTTEPITSQKGSVWTVEFDGKKPTNGTYHPPT